MTQQFVRDLRAGARLQTFLVSATAAVLTLRLFLKLTGYPELGPGGLCHVEAATPRQIISIGEEDLVLVVVGAKDGYVGRDGQPTDPSKLG